MEWTEAIKHRLDAIDDHALAVSGLCHVFYGLKMDSEGMDEKELEQFPALATFGKGIHDLSFAHACRVLADAIEEQSRLLRFELIPQG